MAPEVLLVAGGAQRCALVGRPPTVGVSFRRVAPVAEGACDKTAIDAGAIESLFVTDSQDLHRDLRGLHHGFGQAFRVGACFDGVDAGGLDPDV